MLQDRVDMSRFGVHVWALHCRVSDPRQWTYPPGKDKAIPLQAQTVPGGWGSQISRQPVHEGGKVVRPTHRPPLPPENIPVIHFCYRPNRPQENSAAGRITLMKNFNDTIGNRTRDHPACSAVPQPTAPPRAPVFLADDLIILWLFTHSSYVWLLRTTE